MSQSSEDLPIKLAGGNAVGLFITDAKQCDGILPGDQIMQVSNENTTALAYLLLSLLSMFIVFYSHPQINGQSTANMTYEEAMVELKSSTQLDIEVLHNHQGKYNSVFNRLN